MSYAPTDPATAPPLLALLPDPAGEHERLIAKRAAARASFAATGLPTQKNEQWRYTSLKALLKQPLTNGPADGGGLVDALPRLRPADRPGARLVLVNGRYRPDLSDVTELPQDFAVIYSLTEAIDKAPEVVLDVVDAVLMETGGPLAALNTAGFPDGLCLLIGGADPGVLLEIVNVAVAGEPAAPLGLPRLLIVAAPGGDATVVEHHVSAGAGVSVTNQVTEIGVTKGATLRHYIAQRTSDSALHFSTTGVAVTTGGRYDSFALNLGGRLARHSIDVRLGGEGASCTLDGAYMVRGQQHTDTSTRIDHVVPETTSRQVYKGTVDDAAHGVFQGKIVVRPGAVKTDGHQLSRALLLSDHAAMDAKPELEIYADDVKCSHGATCGELDDDALFFLRARGIPKDEARALLISAFLAESVEMIADADVRAGFAALIRARLGQSDDPGGLDDDGL